MQEKKQGTGLNDEIVDYELWIKTILENSLLEVMVLKSIRDNNSDIVDFKFLYANKKLIETLDREGLSGKRLLNEFPGSLHSGLFNHYVEVTESGQSWEDELLYNYDDFEYWVSVKVIKLDDGCLVTFSDISDQRKARVQLKYNEKLLQATLDSSLSQIQVYEAVRDEQGKIVDFKWLLQNHLSIKVLGDVTGKSLLKNNPGVAKTGIFDRLVRVTNTGVPEQTEIEYTHEKFNNFFFQSVVKLNDGVATTVTDITEQKNKEQELLHLKEDIKNKAVDRYNALFNSIDQGYCTIKLKFDKNGKPVDYLFLEVSPSFESQTGIKDGKGKWMRDIAANQDEFWFQKYGSVALTRKSDRFEYFSTPLKRWWSVYAFPIDDPELKQIGVLFYDITDRKKEEKEKEELFNKIDREKAVFTATLDSLPIAVWIADKNGRLIQSNDITNEIWGEHGRFASGIKDYKKYKRWKSGSDKPLEAEDWAMARAIQNGETIIGEEVQIQRFDGEKAFILSNAAPIRDESGSIIGGVTVVQDITQQKKIELELKTAEEKKAYLLKLSDALHFLDDPVHIQYKAVCILGEHLGADRAGYAEDNGDGTTVTVRRNYTNGVHRIEGIFNYNDYGSGFLKEFQKGQTVMRDDIAFDPSVSAKEKEEHRNLQIGATINKPLLKNGKLLAILFVHFKEKHYWTNEEIALLDETAERTWAAVEWARAEESLKKAEDNYRIQLEKEVKKRTAELLENRKFTQLVTDSIPDLLFVYDIEKWKIIYVNEGITSILGYLPEEVYSSDRKGFEQMLHPDDLKRRINEMAKMSNLKPGEVRETEFRIKDRNGKIHWLDVRDLFFKADNNGKTMQALSICQDVTEKKKVIDAYKKEKNRSKELKRMNELMDTFVFAAAHDLKAPVSNLQMLTKVIENTDDTEKKLKLQQRYSEVIETLDNTISGLVKVLAVEKDLDSGTKLIHFHKVFSNVIAELSEEINSVQPEIHTDFSECKSIAYIETYVYSIFRNMLSNAMKFRLDDRKLVIDIRSGCEKSFVWLSFSDNGTGIDLRQYGDDLFKPFKRFTSKIKGSGLGLHLVKSIVTKNGGSIEVESKKSEGTTFKVYLMPYKE